MEVTSGVRQGCPLSLLLFLFAVEPLLRKPDSLRPGNKYRAYADDIGAVIQDIPRDMPAIIRAFKEFEKVSGLSINITKTVIFPATKAEELDANTINRYEGYMAHTDWHNVKVERQGKIPWL